MEVVVFLNKERERFTGYHMKVGQKIYFKGGTSLSHPIPPFSPTNMATETQSAPASPELKIFNRVASIPLVNDTFSAVHSSLISNPYTRSPYTTAQALSLSALRVSEPIAAKLAPIIIRADGFAIKGLDAVESRYPYPFTVQSEDLLKTLKESSDYARDVANKTIDERVRSPAYSAAQGIDQVRTPLFHSSLRNNDLLIRVSQKRLAPVVDYLIARLGAEENSSETESKYQIQRAYALSRGLKDQILDYSNSQLQQLQSNSVLVYVQFYFSAFCLLISPCIQGNVPPRQRRTSKTSRPRQSSPLRQKLAS
jgi:hypothetical protein